MGGNRVDFIRHYANVGMQLVLDPGHAGAWAEMPEKDGYNQMIEQYLLAACLDYHRFHPESDFRGITIRYLFPSLEDAFNPQSAARVGYTHLLGDTKSNPEVMARLERRVTVLDPAFYRHCERVAAAGA